jgi:hypothetical protein
VAESIEWFGGAGQNAGPWEIPLELFQERVADLRRSCDRIVVVGTSFGSEAAMLTGVHTAGVDVVVAFAPSDVVWAGVTSDGRQTSHWTLGGEPLPFVPLLKNWRPDGDPPSFRALYELSRAADPDSADAAGIAVERIRELVLVAGGDDLVWPSDQQALSILARRAHQGLATTVVVDQAAGHRAVLPGEPAPNAGMRMMRGGSASADRRLGAAAWDSIRQLMDDLASTRSR